MPLELFDDPHRAKAAREEAIAKHGGAKTVALEEAIIINSSDDVIVCIDFKSSK